MSGQTRLLTGDEYIALLLERQAEYMTKTGMDPDTVYKPLLEWFVREGDEELVDPEVLK